MESLIKEFQEAIEEAKNNPIEVSSAILEKQLVQTDIVISLLQEIKEIMETELERRG